MRDGVKAGKIALPSLVQNSRSRRSKGWWRRRTRTDENLLLATYPKGFANIILQPQRGGSNSWADERANRWLKGVGRGNSSSSTSSSSSSDGSSAATAHKHVQHVMQFAYAPHSPFLLLPSAHCGMPACSCVCQCLYVCVRACVHCEGVRTAGRTKPMKNLQKNAAKHAKCGFSCAFAMKKSVKNPFEKYMTARTQPAQLRLLLRPSPPHSTSPIVRCSGQRRAASTHSACFVMKI